MTDVADAANDTATVAITFRMPVLVLGRQKKKNAAFSAHMIANAK